MLVENVQLLDNPNLKCYISTGFNRTPGCLDWGENNLVCLGSCNNVAIYNPTPGAGKIICTLPGHTNRINSVRWIRACDSFQETELVSSSSDSTAIVWSLVNGEFVARHVLKGHQLSVTSADGIYQSAEKSNCIVATASADSSVKLWLRENYEGEFNLIDTIDLGLGLCLFLRLTCLPKVSKALLALATDDCKVHLYVGSKRCLSLDGHQDWVRALSFKWIGTNEVWLASGGQDASIRLWKLIYSWEDKIVSSLESIIHGHEGWIYGLQWDLNSDGACRLLSCSLDRTIVIWSLEPESDLWLEECRLGEMGGNTLGYLSVCFSLDSSKILAASFQGALHKWKSISDGDKVIWKSVGCVGGHFDSAESIAWESGKGRYLISCSLDQTTRLHMPAKETQDDRWYEVSRPQVHGHALWCVATLPNHKFASASEEKVTRIFAAPSNILGNLANINKSISKDEIEGLDAVGAAVPSLGLSNKAVTQADIDIGSTKDEGRKHPNEEYIDSYFVPIHLKDIPTEDTLQQNTLWAEVKKLYGHGYEVFTLAASHKGDILASACKATAMQHATIILWNTKTWEQMAQLAAHNLTVTRLEFSPDDTLLLSVSRDRQWALSGKQDDGTWAVLKRSEKGKNPHTRIIWCCGWSPSGCEFATCSRDGKLAVWAKDGVQSGSPLSLSSCITALAVTSYMGSLIIAVGMETGEIHVYKWSPSNWFLLLTVPKNLSCSLCVKRLSFHPQCQETEWLSLAAASQDFSVRIIDLKIQHYIGGT